jgi:hypothetical protein
MNKNKRAVKRLSIVEKTRNDCKLDNIVSEGNFLLFPRELEMYLKRNY